MSNYRASMWSALSSRVYRFLSALLFMMDLFLQQMQYLNNWLFINSLVVIENLFLRRMVLIMLLMWVIWSYSLCYMAALVSWYMSISSSFGFIVIPEVKDIFLSWFFYSTPFGRVGGFYIMNISSMSFFLNKIRPIKWDESMPKMTRDREIPPKAMR